METRRITHLYLKNYFSLFTLSIERLFELTVLNYVNKIEYLETFKKVSLLKSYILKSIYGNTPKKNL